MPGCEAACGLHVAAAFLPTADTGVISQLKASASAAAGNGLPRDQIKLLYPSIQPLSIHSV
jgi:hypothetical protein